MVPQQQPAGAPAWRHLDRTRSPALPRRSLLPPPDSLGNRNTSTNNTTGVAPYLPRRATVLDVVPPRRTSDPGDNLDSGGVGKNPASAAPVSNSIPRAAGGRPYSSVEQPLFQFTVQWHYLQSPVEDEDEEESSARSAVFTSEQAASREEEQQTAHLDRDAGSASNSESSASTSAPPAARVFSFELGSRIEKLLVERLEESAEEVVSGTNKAQPVVDEKLDVEHASEHEGGEILKRQWAPMMYCGFEDRVLLTHQQPQDVDVELQPGEVVASSTTTENVFRDMGCVLILARLKTEFSPHPVLTEPELA
eukprot:GSA120T00011050001.1